MFNKIKLTELIDVDILQNLQDGFSEMTGMASLTADRHGVAVTKPSGFTEFCIKYTRKSPMGQKRCEQCDRMGAVTTFKSGSSCTYYCHAGLIDFAAPIVVDGKMIGSYIGGQVLTSPPDLDKTREIAIELGINPDEYVEAIKKVNVITEAQADKAAKFLCTLAKNFSNIAYKGYCLYKSNIEIEKAMKMKSDFLANMSHEIRTPMNAVLGLAELALREDMTPSARNYVHQIQTSGKNLLVIINDILDFSKIESGKMEIVEVEYEPLSLVNDLSNIVNARIGNKDVEFIMDIDPDMPAKLWGDNVRIHQVILNLLTNAVKFTNEGRVKLSIEFKHKPNEEDMGLLVVTVSDTGIGIKQNDIDKLFDSFQQLDSKRNRNIEGTGLGLAICKQLITLMHGRLNVKSEYRKGSAFKFNIPQSIIDPQPIAKEPKKNITCAFLVNNPYVKEQLNKDLERLCNETIDLVETGESIDSIDVDYFIISKCFFKGSIEEFFKNNPDKKCLIIEKFNGIIDSELPNVRVIRQPIYSVGLYNAMGVECIDINQDSNRNNHITFIAPEAHILIVDDNQVNLVVAKGLLEPLKMNVDTASSGAEAVNMVSENIYDLIFMDHMMPEVDGVETTHVIRDLIPGYSSTPIIALTANAIGEAREMFIREGMNDFVAKPIEVKNIVSKLRKWLPQDKILPISKASTVNSIEKPSLDIAGLNTKAALELLGSEELYMNVLKEYYCSIDKKLKTIVECKNAENWRNFTIEVHALKSTSKQIGADLVATLAADMERAGNANDIDYINANTDRLIDEYSKYKTLLKDVFPDLSVEHEEKSADIEIIRSLLGEMQSALEEFDTLLIDEVIEKMTDYKYPEKYSDIFERLKKAAENSEIDQCADISAEWLAQL